MSGGRQRAREKREECSRAEQRHSRPWVGEGVETCCHDILMGARWALEWGDGNEVNMTEMWDFFFVGMGWWR